MSKAKSEYYTKSITPKQITKIYGITKSPITQAKISPRPQSTDTTSLTNSFSTFLQDKIAKL